MGNSSLKVVSLLSTCTWNAFQLWSGMAPGASPILFNSNVFLGIEREEMLNERTQKGKVCIKVRKNEKKMKQK